MKNNNQNKWCSHLSKNQNDSTPIVSLKQGCTHLLILLTAFFTACTPKGSGDTPDEIDPEHHTVYILNEGNYMASNGSLSSYKPYNQTVIADFFAPANGGAPLGDSPTEFTTFKGKGYITLSGSGKIYIIELSSGKLLGKIIDLNSPRHIQFISETKAYVSNLWSPVIDIINPTTYLKTGSIDLGEGNCAEDFVMTDPNTIFTNCWSYGTKILKIDPRTDKVTGSLEVGIQPVALYSDRNGMLWTMTDGGWEGNSLGYADPELIRIDPTTFEVNHRMTIKRSETAMYNFKMNGAKDCLYYINDDVYALPVNATSLPTTPLIKAEGRNFYSIGVDPVLADIYVSDAIDFQQQGVVYRYTNQGKMVHSFKAGIIPGAFGFSF